MASVDDSFTIYLSSEPLGHNAAGSRPYYFAGHKSNVRDHVASPQKRAPVVWFDRESEEKEVAKRAEQCWSYTLSKIQDKDEEAWLRDEYHSFFEGHFQRMSEMPDSASLEKHKKDLSEGYSSPPRSRYEWINQDLHLLLDIFTALMEGKEKGTLSEEYARQHRKHLETIRRTHWSQYTPSAIQSKEAALTRASGSPTDLA